MKFSERTKKATSFNILHKIKKIPFKKILFQRKKDCVSYSYSKRVYSIYRNFFI
jgi:hypothetical protein